ncbi:AAA family ATPase [Streptomyces vilmorinianum]|uniref:AAA family ATPase n=1 Tax=Streptomyces vilmorinianum TaxID=3051092 RepID=UPI0010FBAAA7|nr:AAA family ATPase [Streptomyces vilmorinianum]
MKRYGHGLVLGRFCPPHAGHHYLVRTALDRCERLTVLVLGRDDDPLPLADRVAWMREIHPDVLVIGTDADRDAGTDAGADDVLRAAVTERVDAVFGRRFGAQPVHVDPGPRLSPVTSADVRRDPAGHWDALEPPVRAALTRRVVVLGGESTGATTTALALTDHYRRRGGVWARTRCVPDITAPLGAGRRSEDFPVVAQRQAELEEEAARAGSPVLFCDGDAFATAIRHERYLGTASPATGEIAARSRQHLWLLTDHRGVPFDRDRADDAGQLRAWMTARLLTQLTHTGRPMVLLTGPHEERLATAVAAVDELLADLPPEGRR